MLVLLARHLRPQSISIAWPALLQDWSDYMSMVSTRKDAAYWALQYMSSKLSSGSVFAGHLPYRICIALLVCSCAICWVIEFNGSTRSVARLRIINTHLLRSAWPILALWCCSVAGRPIIGIVVLFNIHFFIPTGNHVENHPKSYQEVMSGISPKPHPSTKVIREVIRGICAA